MQSITGRSTVSRLAIEDLMTLRAGGEGSGCSLQLSIGTTVSYHTPYVSITTVIYQISDQSIPIVPPTVPLFLIVALVLLDDLLLDDDVRPLDDLLARLRLRYPRIID